jgi:hypothetical protein
LIPVPEAVPQVGVLQRHGELIFSHVTNRSVPTPEQVALLVPHEGPGSHSGVNSRGLARGRFFLIRELGDEVVLHPRDRQELGVIKVSNHSVMREVLEEERHPSVGIGPDGEGDLVPVDAAPKLDLEGLCRLGDRRLPPATSAIRS